MHVGHRLGRKRTDYVEHGLQIRLDDRQGRAQLMGDVRRHPAPEYLLASYRLGHGVESHGQLSRERTGTR